MQSSNSNNANNNNVTGASTSVMPRSPRSLEAGADDAPAAGFVDVRLSVAVPPSPYRSSFSATGGTTKTVGSAQSSPLVAEGGVRVVFKVRFEVVRNWAI